MRLISLGLSEPTRSKLVIPTDLLIGAWRDLFPVERLAFIGGRNLESDKRVSCARDVTGTERSSVHVHASPALLGQALLDFEATGVHVVAWLHSHPGRGPMATQPSSIDRVQDIDLRKNFGNQLVGLIATHDGYLRAWGRAVDAAAIDIMFEGSGIEPVEGESHVYKLLVC